MVEKKFNDLKLTDLKYLLVSKGLDKTGNKQTLLDRLSQALIREGVDYKSHLFEIPLNKINRSESAESFSEDSMSNKDNMMNVNDDTIYLSSTTSNEIDEGTTKESECMITSEEIEDVFLEPNNLESSELNSKESQISNLTFITKVDALDFPAENKNTTLHLELPKSVMGKIADQNDILNIGVGENQNELDLDIKKDVLNHSLDEKTEKPSNNQPSNVEKDDEKSMANKSHKRKATSSKPGKSIQDKNVSTKKKEPSKKDAVVDKNQNIWISGLSSETKAAQLKELFSQHGKVLAAKVVTTAKSPGSKCFGFVTMATLGEAKKCYEKLNQTELNGQAITIDLAKAQPPAPPVKMKEEEKSVPPAEYRSKRKSTLTWSFKDKQIKVINMDNGDKKGEMKVLTTTLDAKKKEAPPKERKKSISSSSQSKSTSTTKPKNDDKEQPKKPTVKDDVNNKRKNTKNSLPAKPRVYSHNVVAKQRALNMRQRQEAWKLQKESQGYKERLTRPTNQRGPEKGIEDPRKTSTGLKYTVNVEKPPKIGSISASSRIHNINRNNRDITRNNNGTRFKPSYANSSFRSQRARPFSFYTSRLTRTTARSGAANTFRGRRPQTSTRGNTFRASQRGMRGNRGFARNEPSRFERSRMGDDRNFSSGRRNDVVARGRRMEQPSTNLRTFQRFDQRNPPTSPRNATAFSSSRYDQRRRTNSDGNSNGAALRGFGSKALTTFYGGHQRNEYDNARRSGGLTEQGRTRQRHLLHQQESSSLLGPQPASTSYRSGRGGLNRRSSPPQNVRHLPARFSGSNDRNYRSNNIAKRLNKVTTPTYSNNRSLSNRVGGASGNHLRESPLGSGRYHHSFPARPTQLSEVGRQSQRDSSRAAGGGGLASRMDANRSQRIRPRSPFSPPDRLYKGASPQSRFEDGHLYKGLSDKGSGRGVRNLNQRQPLFESSHLTLVGGSLFSQDAIRMSPRKPPSQPYHDDRLKNNIQAMNPLQQRHFPPTNTFNDNNHNYESGRSLLGPPSNYEEIRSGRRRSPSIGTTRRPRQSDNLGSNDVAFRNFGGNGDAKRRRPEPRSPPHRSGGGGSYQTQRMLGSSPPQHKRSRNDSVRSQATYPMPSQLNVNSRMGPPAPTGGSVRRFDNSSGGGGGKLRLGFQEAPNYYSSNHPHQQQQQHNEHRGGSPSRVGSNSLGSLILGGNNSFPNSGDYRTTSNYMTAPGGPGLPQGYHQIRDASSNLMSSRDASPPRRRNRNGPNTPQQPPYHYKRY